MSDQRLSVFLFLLTTFSFSTIGQSKSALIKKIESPASESDKLTLYNQLLSTLYEEGNDSLLFYSEQYLDVAKRKNRPMHQIYALEFQALYYDLYKSDYSISFQRYEQALEICDKHGIDYKRDLYHGIGILFHVSDDYEKALRYYKLAIENAKNDPDFKKKVLTNMASIQSSLGNYDEAETLFLEAIDIETESISTTNALYSNLGNLYLRKNEPQKAIPYLNRAIQIAYRNQLMDGIFYDLSYLLDAKVSMDDRSGLDSLIRFVEDHEESIVNLRERTIIYRSIYNALKMQGDFKGALMYQDKYISGYDSLIGLQRSDLVYELEAKYDNEKKEKEIAQLEVEQQRARNQRNVWFMISGLVLVLAISLFILLRTKSKSNAIISKSLAEKETLLKEIHHRVKNNLQVVSSLLSMQSRFIKDENALGAVNEGQHRVASMALIHQKLYQENNLSGVSAKDYISDLTDTLVEAYGVEGRVDVTYDVDQLNIDVDTIIPMGLILNELISNTFKHAFPDGREGELSIYLKEQDEKLKLLVSDDGVGQQEVKKEKNTFGSILIQSLAQKLNATFTTQNEKGFSSQLIISKYKLVQ